jgi:hypothetical protein
MKRLSRLWLISIIHHFVSDDNETFVLQGAGGSRIRQERGESPGTGWRGWGQAGRGAGWGGVGGLADHGSAWSRMSHYRTVLRYR